MHSSVDVMLTVGMHSTISIPTAFLCLFLAIIFEELLNCFLP